VTPNLSHGIALLSTDPFAEEFLSTVLLLPVKRRRRYHNLVKVISWLKDKGDKDGDFQFQEEGIAILTSSSNSNTYFADEMKKLFRR